MLTVRKEFAMSARSQFFTHNGRTLISLIIYSSLLLQTYQSLHISSFVVAVIREVSKFVFLTQLFTPDISLYLTLHFSVKQLQYCHMSVSTFPWQWGIRKIGFQKINILKVIWNPFLHAQEERCTVYLESRALVSTGSAVFRVYHPFRMNYEWAGSLIYF